MIVLNEKKGTLTINGRGNFVGIKTSESSIIGVNIEISGGTFENSFPTEYLAKNVALKEQEDGTFKVDEATPVAMIGEDTYTTLKEAVGAAGSGSTITLLENVYLGEMLTLDKADVELDLNGYTISASVDFVDPTPTGSEDATSNDNHLIDVTANDVTITGGTLKAGTLNNHTLNIWNASNVTLENVTLDGSAAGMDGAPLVVGASDVTLDGKVNFVTGANSWYGANVDTRKVNGTKTPAQLTLGEGAEAHFTGTNQIGIYVENSANFAKPGNLEIAFEEGSAITTDIDPFTAIVFSDKHDASGNATVTDPENAGLMQDEDGNYIVKPAPAPQPQQPAGGSSHKHNYTWQHSDDEHWQYCADCGQAISNGPHTLQWKDGYQECTVCGYRVGSSTAAAPAAQASAPAAAAPAANTAAAAPAAGTATTAAATSTPPDRRREQPPAVGRSAGGLRQRAGRPGLHQEKGK